MERVRFAMTVSIFCVAAIFAAGCGRTTEAPATALDQEEEVASVLSLTSSAFSADQIIPARFAMQGARGGRNTSIPYDWTGAPSATRSFALLLVDRKPAARDWVHWAVVDIPAETSALAEGASGSSAMPTDARELANTYGSRGYGGPLPPPGNGRHPYETTLYALDIASLDVSGDVTAAAFEGLVGDHVLARATFTGYFETE